MLRCDRMWCDKYDMIRYDTIWCDTTQHDTTRFDILPYDKLWYDMIYDIYDMTYDTIQYYMAWPDITWHDMWYIWYGMIYEIFLKCNWVDTSWQYSSSTVHIYIKTINRTNQTTLNSTNNNRTTKIANNLEECGPCSVLTNFTLAFVLQMRKKHRKTSVRVAEEF